MLKQVQHDKYGLKEEVVKVNEIRGISFAMLTAIVSGISIVVNKVALGGVNPFLFTGLKNIVVAMLFFSLIPKTVQLIIRSDASLVSPPKT